MVKKNTSAKKDLVITGQLDGLLEAVGWLHYARAKQLTRLSHSPASIELIQRGLKKLVDAEYLQAFYIFSGSQATPMIYRLDGKGMQYLKETGRIEPDRYFRPSDSERSAFFLPHTLDVNDFMIALMLLVKNDEHFQLLERKHEIDIKREQKKNTVKVKFSWVVNGEVVQDEMFLYPDGFVALSYQSPDMDTARRFPLWLEIDRNTETRAADFRKRIRAIIEYARPKKEILPDGTVTDKELPSDFELKYGFKMPIVTYLITQGGQARANVLTELARIELASTGEKIKFSRMFRFAVAPASWDYFDEKAKTGSPLEVARNLAFSKIWAVPFAGHELSELLRIGK